MRGLLCAVLSVVVVVGLALSCHAEQVAIAARVLPVFDQNGNPVPASIAKATGFAPVSLENGKPQNILISAAVLPSLKVNLSSTQIAWEIKKTGTYQTKAIDIAIGIDDDNQILTTNDEQLCPIPVATMVVAGAENLVEPVRTDIVRPIPVPRSLPTFYALLPTAAKGVPQEYVPADKFNGGHALRNIRTSIWNKLMVSDNFIDVYNGYPAGKYQDEFTVTFFQAL